LSIIEDITEGENWNFGCYTVTHVQQPNKIINDVRVKSTTKTYTDHHNGDIKFQFSPSEIVLVDIRCLQSSLNYSLNYLINFNTASVFI